VVRLIKQTGDSLAFSGDDPAYQILEDRVAGRHGAAAGKVLQDFPQNVDQLRGAHGDPLRFTLQVLLRRVATPRVVEKIQDDLLLFETSGL
jgi:hypothetical protein